MPKAFLLIAFGTLATGCISDAERAETIAKSDNGARWARSPAAPDIFGAAC